MKSTFLFLSILMVCGLVQGYVITFEDLPLGVTYDAGNSPISSGGVQIDLLGAGSTTVQNVGNAGGTGQELWISNIDLDFDFSIVPLQGLSFQFGEYGNGVINLEINGLLVNDFASANGTDFNGAVATVLDTGTLGAVFVTGPISSFSIGGQELAIDNVIACIPEPATLALMGLGALVLRRRKK